MMFEYPMEGFIDELDINCVFFSRGLCPVLRQNFAEFFIDIRVLDYSEYLVVI